MDQLFFFEYLKLREKVLLEELETVTSMLSNIEAKKDFTVRTRDEIIDQLELDVIRIMKANGGAWMKKGLVLFLKKSNLLWEKMSDRELMKSLSMVFASSAYIRRAKPHGWELLE